MKRTAMVTDQALKSDSSRMCMPAELKVSAKSFTDWIEGSRRKRAARRYKRSKLIRAAKWYQLKKLKDESISAPASHANRLEAAFRHTPPKVTNRAANCKPDK